MTILGMRPPMGSDSETESVDLHSWTRSGGPLMRTTSADIIVDLIQSLDADSRLNRTAVRPPNIIIPTLSRDTSNQGSPMLTTPNRTCDTTPNRNSDTEIDQREYCSGAPYNNSSIMVGEGDLLQAGRIGNGIVFNVVKKDDLTPSNGSQDSENNGSPQDSVAECVKLDISEKEVDTSDDGGDEDVEVKHCADEAESSTSDPKIHSSTISDGK